MNRLFIACVLMVGLFARVSGETTEKKIYTATRITAAPSIDGNLDDPTWKTGTWIDDFTQNQPFSGRAASQRTEFNIQFDDNNIYVAIKAFDTSPDSIVRRLTRRDDVDGDLVAVIFDSYHDLRTAFLFGVSAGGVKFDKTMTNDGQNEDTSWDPNWWVQTRINTEGWTAEMKIPFSQVRFDKNSGVAWGLEVARNIYRSNETDYWRHIPKDAPGFVHLFGELKGLDEIKPRKIFDVTPYTVAKAETFEKVPDNPFLAKGHAEKLNAGLDAKIGVTNNMTMDLTINPDFGQVEADPSEVNLTAYETFFKEKRPFFIEGKNITNFNLGVGDGENGNDNLFYSRRIGRRPQISPDLKDNWYADIPIQTTILGAAKLTGKTQDGLSVAFIDALTNNEFAEIDTLGGRFKSLVEPLTNYFVGRVQKDSHDGKTLIGGMITGTNRELNGATRDYLHKSAYTGGIDFTQYLQDKNWEINFNAAFSLVQGSAKAITETQKSPLRYFQRPDNNYTRLDTTRTSLTGSGGKLLITKLNGHWNFMGVAIWKSPGFETNDIGYLREADQVLGVAWGQYNQFNPKGIYRSYNLNCDVFSVWNFGGFTLAKGFEWNASMNFKNFWNIYTGGNFQSNNLDQTILRGGPMMRTPGSWSYRLNVSTDSRKKTVLGIYTNFNKGYEKNYSRFYTETDLSYKPTNYLAFSLIPTVSKSSDELQYVKTLTVNDQNKYVFASIDQNMVSTSFRINLNLSPDLTLQYWGQPFIATGKYYDYKLIDHPMAEKYRDRFTVFSPGQITLDGDQYLIDENRDGKTDYQFDRMDFKVKQFLSNLVLRWEYSPGSSVYLVWSQSRNVSDSDGGMNYFSDLGNLFNSADNKPHNVFLIKFSYRFGLK